MSCSACSPSKPGPPRAHNPAHPRSRLMTLVAAAQFGPVLGDPDANRATAAGAVRDAAAQGARLVVLPELSDSGYVFTGPDEARALATRAADSPTLNQWRDLSTVTGCVVVGGFCELGEDGLLYNSAALVDESGTRAVYRKAHLWDREKLIFTPGAGAPPVITLPFGRVAVMICYDLEFPEWTRLATLDGADLIAAPVNWPAAPCPPGERPAEVVKVQADASVNGVYVVVADRCGTERGVDWISGSLIAGPEGYPLAGPVLADRPDLLIADCDLPGTRDKRINSRNDLLGDRRPDLSSAGPGGTDAGGAPARPRHAGTPPGMT